MTSTTITTEPTTKNDEDVVNLLDNLSVFIIASTNLIESLQKTIQSSKQKSGDPLDEEVLCGCTKLSDSANFTGKSDFLGETAKTEDIKKQLDETTKTNLDITDEPLDCSCLPELQQSVKETKSKTSTKSKKLKKELKETFAKEKTEKLTQLKVNLQTTQQNLLDIQEQVRQLERLYQDYDSVNTSDGHVNPAALYKEIMKPQSVPYINTEITTVKVSQKSTICTAPCQSSESCTRAGGSGRNPQYYKCPKPSVSILSTTAFNNKFY